MRISDWSSDVCSSDLGWFHRQWLAPVLLFLINVLVARWFNAVQMCRWTRARRSAESLRGAAISCDPGRVTSIETGRAFRRHRSEERRVGKERVSTFRVRCAPSNYKKKHIKKII